MLEMQDTSLRGEKDVEDALRLPVLAMIPAIKPMLAKRPGDLGKLPPAVRSIGLGERA
jgi:hypothetical protein